MANKTLIIKMDPSATFTGGSTASSGIATYNNKIITGVGTGSTNLTLNFASSKVASRTFNKVFNIKVKSKLEILQDEYDAACAAIEEVQNWFKNNGSAYSSSFTLDDTDGNYYISNNTNIIYGSKPTYTNLTLNAPVGLSEYGAINPIILYSDYGIYSCYNCGDECSRGRDGYGNIFDYWALYITYTSSSYAIVTRFFYTQSKCRAYSSEIKADNVTINNSSLISYMDNLNKHRYIVTIYNELQAEKNK